MLNANFTLLSSSSIDPTEEGTDDCQDFHLGVNIFNCRTEVEWRKAAENQCSLRLTTSTEALFVQVKYACRSGTGGDPVFMQAAVSCCGSGQENMEKPTQELTPPSPATTQCKCSLDYVHMYCTLVSIS